MELNRGVIERSFLDESAEGLATIEALLVGLEQRPDHESVNTIFRICHTIKGNALALDFAAVSELSHAVEDLLDRVRGSNLIVSSTSTDLLLRAVDALRRLLGAGAQDRHRLTGSDLQLVADLRTACSHTFAPEWNGISNGGSTEFVPTVEAQPAGLRTETSTRVQIEKLDRLISLWGEIAIARGRLSNALQSSSGANIAEALQIHHGMEQLCSEIQEIVFKLRMVPVGPMFRQLNRVVRNLAKSANKMVRLEIRGADVELDTRVIEQIRDPLVHMIRNAVDHGIESKEQRALAGKPSCGVIRIEAFRRPGSIVIEVSDDGAGLNHERILERARSEGLINDGHGLSDQEIHQLIFRPGLSTAEQVTDISGRGVGMDVVYRNIHSLRGSVSVLSTGTHGTTLRIQLPLTLAIIEGFMVRIGLDAYIVPMDAIVECVEMPADEARDSITGVLNLRSEPVPYIRLSQMFSCETCSNRENIVVVQHEGKKAGIAVEQLVGTCQVVIKPLGQLLGDIHGLAGSTILGDGTVALILDVPGVINKAVQEAVSPDLLSA